MIKPETLQFTSFEVLCPSNSCIFVSSTEKKQFNTQTHSYTEKTIGYVIEVVLPQQAYEKINVKVPVTCNIDNLKVDDKISFIGFSGKFVKNYETGEYFFSAKADDIEIPVEF